MLCHRVHHESRKYELTAHLPSEITAAVHRTTPTPAMNAPAFVNLASPTWLAETPPSRATNRQSRSFRCRFVQRRSALPTHFNVCSHACFLWSMTAENVQPESDPKFDKRELSPEVKELRSVLKKCPLYLIGPMGSGKSAVGRYLARELGFHFLDTDTLIEQLMKKPVAQIFGDDGELTFRDVETQVLAQISSFIGCCVATGGGIVLKKDNWGHLQTGIVIYLDTPVDILYHRLKTQSETENRPLLKTATDDPEELRNKIETILNDRQHLYMQADVCISCANHEGVDDTAKEIVRVLTNFIKENPPKLSALFMQNQQ